MVMSLWPHFLAYSVYYSLSKSNILCVLYMCIVQFSFVYVASKKVKVKVARTRLPSVGFRG